MEEENMTAIEFVSTTTFKRVKPKFGYCAASIRLPWNTHLGLIGKAVNIIKTAYGFAVVTDMSKFNEFKPFFGESVEVRQVESPIEGRTLGPTGKEPQYGDETRKERCEGWDSNPWTPSGVDLKSTAFGRAWLPSL